MPILKNAKKKVRVIKNKTKSNNEYLASMKNTIKDLKKVIDSGDKNKAKEDLNAAIIKIDKALRKGVVHKNKANRHKSKLSKSVNTMK